MTEKTTDLALAPHEIESESFRIITEELGDREFDPLEAPVIKRVIHTTADFSFADTLAFSAGAVQAGLDALRAGATIVTDTNMARSGVSKSAAAKLGCEVKCFMADEDVAATAKENGTTRAVACMDKAARLEGPIVLAIGNAPTALLRACELIEKGELSPALVIGAPVGFVHVVESKERLLDTDVASIVARGRKGGSTVAAAIVNALLYEITRAKAAR